MKKIKKSMVISPKEVVYTYSDKDNGEKLITCEITCYNCSRTFKGHALCNVADVYDEKFGEELSYARAIDKIVNANDRKIVKILKKIERDRNEAIERRCYPIQCKNEIMAINNDRLYERLNNELKSRN